MILAKCFSEMWSAAAPAVGNHLWQSTLFAVVAGLLTLVLRKNQARARYWIWLAASLKFLIPFSLLVGVGSHLGWTPSAVGIETGLTFAIDEFSQPFSQPMSAIISQSTVTTQSPLAAGAHLIPRILPAVWLCGLFAVIFVWAVRWRRMSSAIKDGIPLREGREVEALRRLERAAGLRRRIEIFLSHASLEPGVFGIVRPVLVWPDGISARLGDAHVEAILMHEVWHVRRKDNLFAALHMLVEASFWFHPLVWFLGTRIIQEREVACDEEVLELGSERQVYAESILRICEFCVGSPLACVSGVTGADLKKRIVRIMTRDVARQLGFRKKLLLSAAAFAAIAVPLAFGLANAPPNHDLPQSQNTSMVKFEFAVASIKPSKIGASGSLLDIPGPGQFDSFTARNITLKELIRQAYGIGFFGGDDGRIAGGPNWLDSDKFDIEAKMDSSVAEALEKLRPDQRWPTVQRMLRELLADRLKLVVHSGTRNSTVYSLVIAKDGPKLRESKPADAPSGKPGAADSDKGQPGIQMQGRGGPVLGRAVPMPALVQFLSVQLGRTILDKTGLVGKFDFTLQWIPDDSQPNPKFSMGTGETTNSQSASSDSAGPSLFTAVQEQLGLKLESGKGPLEILVIDHVEKPSGN